MACNGSHYLSVIKLKAEKSQIYLEIGGCYIEVSVLSILISVQQS